MNDDLLAELNAAAKTFLETLNAIRLKYGNEPEAINVITHYGDKWRPDQEVAFAIDPGKIQPRNS